MRLRAHLLLASLTLTAAIWLSSGTMAPYAATWPEPEVEPRCHYLYNGDHPQFRAGFDLLDGAPKSRWQVSVVLRRLLYPLAAYPLMKALGFERGGFVFNILAHLAALWSFAAFVRRRFGDSAAAFASWALATFPGLCYWAGLPYSYAAIVPGSLWLAILLTRLDERPGLAHCALHTLAMGVLFTAYDFLPLFAPACLMVLAVRRRWRQLPVAVVGLTVPSVLVGLWLRRAHGISPLNENTTIYLRIVAAYLHPPGLAKWWHAIGNVPLTAVVVFFASGHVVLPALFVACAAWWRARLRLVEAAIVLSASALFLFNELAPPYDGWPMRGMWIARVYQPLFVVWLLYAVRAWADGPPRLRTVAVVALVLDASLAFGPILRNPAAGVVHQLFYRHRPESSTPEQREAHPIIFQSPPSLKTYNRTVSRFGHRPYGFCKP